jgi:hypothetical protein
VGVGTSGKDIDKGPSEGVGDLVEHVSAIITWGNTLMAHLSDMGGY